MSFPKMINVAALSMICVQRKSVLAAAILATVSGLAVDFPQSHAQAMLQKEQGYQKFLLDAPPSDAQISAVSKSYRDVIVAKIAIVGNFVSNSPQDMSGVAIQPPVYTLTFEVKILEILSGNGVPGSVVRVMIARKPNEPIFPYPRSSSQRQREYFVLSYIDDRGDRRLAGIPMLHEDYRLWQTEPW
jgi:hypothetical protein